MPLALVAEEVAAGAAEDEAARADQVARVTPAGAPVAPGERGRGRLAMRADIEDEPKGNAEDETVEEERVRLVPDERGDGEDAAPDGIADEKTAERERCREDKGSKGHAYLPTACQRMARRSVPKVGAWMRYAITRQTRRAMSAPRAPETREARQRTSPPRGRVETSCQSPPRS